jgi:3-phenylpropionate/cinnamic acid dioxygenase small subunit
MARSNSADLQALTFEIDRFYSDESELLERADYMAWAELLDDELVYVMPQTEFVDRRVNRDLDYIGAHSFDEDKASVLNRIKWLLGGPTPEVPATKRRMLVTNVRVLAVRDNGEVEADSKFLVWEMRSNGHSATFIGHRRDILRSNGTGWKIVRRSAVLDSAVLPKSFTNFF